MQHVKLQRFHWAKFIQNRSINILTLYKNKELKTSVFFILTLNISLKINTRFSCIHHVRKVLSDESYKYFHMSITIYVLSFEKTRFLVNLLEVRYIKNYRQKINGW